MPSNNNQGFSMSQDIDLSELRAFDQNFNTLYEDEAAAARGRFLKTFPINQLKKMTIDTYVIGKGKPSFCSYVEAKTKTWASIQGATSFKFGIYYGRTKSDPDKRYRFTRRFGHNKNEAFRKVKSALLELIKSGEVMDFEGIDKNHLSQMFKAKILSLYFPNTYINICSSDHLKQLALKLGISKCSFASEYQHRLIQKKLENAATHSWSNPKYMSFLYSKYIRGANFSSFAALKKPRAKVHHRVNFEDIIENRDSIGRISEEFALEWEKNRLIGLGYPELISQIDDRRSIPSHGYDFLSHNAPNSKRYIEVKSVGKDRKNGMYRFYLSENEHIVSRSDQFKDSYYFYLVFYGSDGKPSYLSARHTQEIYSSCDIGPCAYLVRFH
jgi:hypothetical protein